RGVDHSIEERACEDLACENRARVKGDQHARNRDIGRGRRVKLLDRVWQGMLKGDRWERARARRRDLLGQGTMLGLRMGSEAGIIRHLQVDAAMGARVRVRRHRLVAIGTLGMCSGHKNSLSPCTSFLAGQKGGMSASLVIERAIRRETTG